MNFEEYCMNVGFCNTEMNSMCLNSREICHAVFHRQFMNYNASDMNIFLFYVDQIWVLRKFVHYLQAQAESL